MKCDACKESFDKVERRPKILPCGHTLCLSCAKAIKKCSVDDKEFPNADELADNYFIIDTIASSHERRFYCLTCKIPAKAQCVEEHDIRNLRNVQKKAITPKLHALRECAALQQDIVSTLVEMLPAVSDSFNRLVETATLRQDAQQQVLERVEGMLEAGGSDAAWERNSKAVDEALEKSEGERPEVEQLLALLRCRALCHLELEVDHGDGQQRVDATVDLSEETSVARALRFVLYHLSTTGNLQVTENENEEESDLGSDWEDANGSESEEVQGATCLELQRPVQSGPSSSRGPGAPSGPSSGSGPGTSSGRNTSRGPARRILRASRQANRANYELLKTLQEQDVVPAMEPFSCPVCLDQYQAGDGVVLKGCLHVFCRSCLKDTVQHSEKAEVQCPYQDDDYSCENVISQREIKTLVPEDVFEQHLDRSMRAAESSMDNTFHCKTVDCVAWCQFEPGVNQFVCNVCFQKNCLQCQVIHDPEDCATYQDRIKRQAETDVEARQTQQQLDAMLASGNAMRCPKCNVVIMKRSGCDALVCAMCSLHICWATKQARWGPKGVGDTSGGCRCKLNGRPCHPTCGNCH